jgi:putative lipoic acid-binding regulatory protein
MSKETDSFREKLEIQYKFPALYNFKFIVPKESTVEVKKIFPKSEHKLKPSRNGKYVSVTIPVMAASSDQIIEAYEKANKIKGIIAL